MSLIPTAISGQALAQALGAVGATTAMPPAPKPQVQQAQIVDLIDRARNSGVMYTPDQAKQELYFSTFSVKGHNDFKDLNGEKIIIFLGDHGVGKTALVHQFGDENEMEVYAFNLGGTVQEDLHGNPEITKTEDGKSVTSRAAAAFAPPFFRKPNSKSGKGIWLLDEIFSGTSMDHQLFVRMVAGRRCDELQMHEGWYIVGTTNPNTNNYMAVRKIDASTADRFIVFPVYSTDEAKLAFWRSRMPELTFKFLLLTHVRKLGYVDATSARNWWNLSIEIDKRVSARAPLTSIENLISTHVNRTVAGDFTNYLAHGEDPHFYPVSSRELVEANSVQMENITRRVDRWIGTNELSLVGATKWDLAQFMRQDLCKGGVNLNKQGIDNISSFMNQIGTKGYIDLVDDLFDACKESDYQQIFLDNTRNTPLRSRMLQIQAAYKASKQQGQTTKG